ncbi:hypothetical protein H4R33_000980 [Dimargaris cristalligena]|nr:hypothetical protein H4R33_000980 [Dimargaris cristalligena]
MLNPLAAINSVQCTTPYCNRHCLPQDNRSKETQLRYLLHSLNLPSSVSFKVDLNFLIRAIRFELGDGGLDSDHVNVGRVETLMSAYQSNKADWQQYAHFDKYKYTRNLVDDGNGQFNLLILAWGPGQKSPIHDHARSHCVMKVLDGSLIETQYHWPQILVDDDGGVSDNTPSFSPPTAFAHPHHRRAMIDNGPGNGRTDEQHPYENPQQPLRIQKETHLKENSVAYIHDRIGLHRVGNSSDVCGSVSLHLYTPPIHFCHSFNESTGHARASTCQTFHSQYGVKNSTSAHKS